MAKRLRTQKQINNEVEMLDLVHRLQRGQALASNSSRQKAKIEEARNRVSELERPYVVRDRGGALGDTIKSLNNDLKNVEGIPKPTEGNSWEKVRHMLTAGAANEVREVADFEGIMQTQERILASEGVSANGCEELRANTVRAIMGAYAAGVVSTERRDGIGKDIAKKIQSERGKKGGKSRLRTAKEKDNELSKWAKPLILRNKSIEANIRHLQNLEKKARRARTSKYKLRKIVKLLMTPKKTPKKA